MNRLEYWQEIADEARRWAQAANADDPTADAMRAADAECAYWDGKPEHERPWSED